MELYLYKVGTVTPAMKIENAAHYTDARVVTEDGAVYEPLTEGYELSSLPDCSETLRADWRRNNPTGQDQLRADVDYLLMMTEG